MHPQVGTLLTALVLSALVGCGTAGEDRPPREPPPAPGEAAGAPGPAATAGPVRHVLLITLDTLRFDAPGFAGDGREATPVMDALAASGRVYANAYSHVPQTLPAHASILTGLYPYQHGVRQNGGFVLADSIPTLATVLAERGFATAAFVAAYPLDAAFGLDRGFGIYDDEVPEVSGGGAALPERRGDEVIARARAWWDEQKAGGSGERRFLWVHLFDPHHPYEPPEPFASRYPDDPYLGEVAATDSYLAPLVTPFLEGREEPTLIVLVADHGEGLGDHGEDRHGLFAYDSTLRVPLVVWRDGMGESSTGALPPGRDERLARHVDIFPTVLDALGVPVTGPGASLLRPAAGGEDGYFEALAGNLQWNWAPLRGVVRDGKKLIALPLPELYDLRRDPGEEENLVRREGGLARELLALLPEESDWPPVAGEMPPEVEANLKSLGYLGGSGGGRRDYGPADDPKNLIGMGNRLGLIQELRNAGELPAAVRLAEEVVAEHPARPQGYDVLSELLLELDRPADAVAVMRRARDHAAMSDALARRLGLTLAAGGFTAEAVEVLRPYAARGDAAFRNALASVLIEGGRAREAVTLLEELLAAEPDDAEAHENLCNAALATSAWAEGRDHCRRAVELDEASSDAWNSLGVALYYLGEGREALAAWEKAVELDPTQFDTLYNIGLKGAELGERAKARQALERFIATAPPARYGRDIAAARARLREL